MDPSLQFAVRKHGEFLATRGSGRNMREELEDEIMRRRPDQVLIDFTGVEAMTISFADEFLGRFYASLAAGDLPVHIVLLSGLNDETREAIAICLERRDLTAAAVLDGQQALLGAPEHLIETYRLAITLGTFSAADLSARLSISPQNANNRLKRLVAAGAIHRQRVAAHHGGKEFTYTVPPPALPPLTAACQHHH